MLTTAVGVFSGIGDVRLRWDHRHGGDLSRSADDRKDPAQEE